MFQVHRAARTAPTVYKKPLRLLLKVWAGSHSGQLLLADGAVAEIVQGEPRSAADLRLLTRAMRDSESPRFVRRDTKAPPAVPVMARTLWKAASHVSDRIQLPKAGPLLVGHGHKRLAAFPLDRATRALLDRGPNLDGLVRSRPEERDAILHDLRVLVALGVYKVPKTLGRTASAERLQSELERLRGADCWTVLGTREASQVERYARRLAKRYDELSRSPDATTAGLAVELLDMVHRAREDALHGAPASRSSAGGLDEHNALRVGREQLDAGRYSNAVRAFAVLKQAQPFNARALAWLGYALTKDPSFPQRQRESRGRRFLEQAESMGSHGGDADLLLARLDIEEGQLVRAWSRLDGALSRYPDNAEVRALLVQVQQDVRPG